MQVQVVLIVTSLVQILWKERTSFSNHETEAIYSPVCFMENWEDWLTLALLNLMAATTTLHNIFWRFILICKEETLQ
jgi:hypothetical protein